MASRPPKSRHLYLLACALFRSSHLSEVGLRNVGTPGGRWWADRLKGYSPMCGKLRQQVESLWTYHMALGGPCMTTPFVYSGLPLHR